jgi:hypothetical protein
MDLRCRLAIRSRVAADEWTSLSSAHRTHLAAKRSHVALLSADRANLAIIRHSPANFRNSSDGFIWSSSLKSDKFFLSNVRPHWVACTAMIAPTTTAVQMSPRSHNFRTKTFCLHATVQGSAISSDPPASAIVSVLHGGRGTSRTSASGSANVFGWEVGKH